jgi:trans-aconitate methyltransferase
MQWIVDHWEILTLALVNLLALAAVLAKLTPSTTDDEWIAKIEEVVKNVVTKKPSA